MSLRMGDFLLLNGNLAQNPYYTLVYPKLDDMDFFPLVKAIYDKIPNITADEIKDMQRAFAKEKKMKDLPSKSQILQSYFKAIREGKLEKNQTFEMLLRKRAIRSLSGIVPVQVLTKPWPCPGQCIFCPNDPGMPKSYIKSEPGAMRAWLNQFDPMRQVYNRLQSLTTTGHQTDKIEMIVLGGSWDAYPRDYKIDFVKQLYDACNTFSDLKIVQGKETCPPLRKEGDHEVVEDFYSGNEKIPSPQGGVSPLNKGEQNNTHDSFPLCEDPRLAGTSQTSQNDNRTQIIGKNPDLESFRNFVCLDTRSREVRNRIEKKKSDFLNLVLRRYRSSAGQECFISFEDELGYLYGFTRLLLPDDVSPAGIEGLESGTAIIRELHVYGQLQKIGEKSDSGTQHTGLGKRLLSFAEKLSKSFGYDQFSVISGVGVREYYKSLGFELKGTYMSKKL